MLIDEHQGRDQLPLRVEQVYLRGGRDHVGEDMADPRAQLVDELDQPLAVAAQFFDFAAGGRVNRTRSSPSWIVAPPVSRFESTLGKAISRR